jgi:hypothetical protein
MVTRAFVLPTVVVGVLCLGVGCVDPGPRRPAPRPTPQADGPEGAGGGGGGGVPVTPDAAAGGSAGGGLGGSGGSGGSGGTGPVDAGGADGPAASGDRPMIPDAPSLVDASASTDAGSGDGGADPGGDPVPGKPWLRLCPRDWDQAKCCQFLCSCLERLCDDSPMDKARFAGCMSMCTKLTDFRARCQVYHCFESKNPGATRDHVSHCGHASGRVAGGSCSIIQSQP